MGEGDTMSVNNFFLYVICGGDWNVDLSRLLSPHTIALSKLCIDDNDNDNEIFLF